MPPATNAGYWTGKVGTNRERDADTDERLVAEGWVPFRVWEHEDPDDAAHRIAALVRDRLAHAGAKVPPGDPTIRPG